MPAHPLARATLLLALFTVPAHADYVPRGSSEYLCSKKKEGDPCGRGPPGSDTCREVTCFKGGDDDDVRDLFSYDCLLCMSEESLQEHYRVTAPFRVRLLENQLLAWGPWALGASCLVTLTWYQLRREHKRSSGQSGPSGSEPPSPPTA